jgi:tetratricopeptide (TPR) repeat protein
MVLCLAAVTLAVFWRATQCEFVNYDDADYVTQNSHVQQGLTTESVRWALAASYEGLWMPLTWLSHMLDWQLYRHDARGHHLTSVLLHAANSVLLFLLLWFTTGSLWRSALAAALFALHPLHVETAAWVSERKGVLSTLFWLLTLCAYAGYARSRAEGQRSRAVGGYALALLFFACGLMTKPMVVTLPFVLLLLDYWPLERWKSSCASQHWGALVVEKIPFFLLAGACSVLTFCAAPAGALSAGQRVSNALISYPRYLAKTLWPAGLATPYPNPWHWPVWETALAAVFLAMATGWVVRQARRRAYLAVGWFWFLGTLVPVLGLVRMSGLYSIADRYTYVPLIGVFVAVAWAAGEAAARSRAWRNAVGALAVALLGLCVWRSDCQLRVWRGSGTLFTHALQVTERNFVAHTNLGFHLESQGRLDEAISHYLQAVRIAPQFETAVRNLFNAQARKARQQSSDRRTE